MRSYFFSPEQLSYSELIFISLCRSTLTETMDGTHLRYLIQFDVSFFFFFETSTLPVYNPLSSINSSIGKSLRSTRVPWGEVLSNPNVNYLTSDCPVQGSGPLINIQTHNTSSCRNAIKEMMSPFSNVSFEDMEPRRRRRGTDRPSRLRRLRYPDKEPWKRAIFASFAIPSDHDSYIFR